MTGPAIGMILAGPAGAFAGAVLGPVASKVISRTCTELYDRVLGHRERLRAGATAAFAITNIEARLRNGESLRDDGFFDAEAGRSSADEIFEGILRKSRNEHQEKKARFYANIFVNAAFDNTISPAAINYVLALSDTLTYRQLCLLQLFSDPQPLKLRDSDYRGLNLDEVLEETRTVIPEAFGMYQQGLIVYRREQGELTTISFTVVSINPGKMGRTRLGDRVHKMLGLEALPREDLLEVTSLLQ